ncbi:MAG: hypothetical protein J6K17_15075 [Oscillospiraceae bacterium]|nr:hypothetical protein [Oscillospiraceae bacterium]
MNVFGVIKNVFKKFSNSFSKLFEKDVVIKITSIIAAIAIWFVISVSEYPIINEIVYNVPIQIALEGTYAEASGYQAMSQSVETVTVYLTGNRGEVGNIKTEDLVAVASADNVMYAMEYNLPLEIESLSNKDFEVTKIEPAIVNVSFDRIITKEIPVSPEITGVNAADGYIMGDVNDIAVVPNKVSVTGPASTVDEITKATVIIREDTILTNTTDFKTNTIKLYNNATVIHDEYGQLKYDKNDFTVHVPVYAKQTVKLDVRITNAPPSFNVEAFKEQLEYSVNELVVAVADENAVERNKVDIGTIDMREVGDDEEEEFTFFTADFLPESYQDWNDVKEITVKCPTEGIGVRPIHITNSSIQLINAPSQFEFKIVTSGVTPMFAGPEKTLEQMTYIDVNAQIDMLNTFDIEEGYCKLPVTFSIPAYDDIWCTGSEGVLSPMATIQVIAKDNN